MLVDDDTFEAPERARETIRSRRDRPSAPALDADPDAVAEARELLARNVPSLEEIFAHPDSDPRLVTEGRRFLRARFGEDPATPLGAAVVLACSVVELKSGDLAVLADALVTRHGVRFLAEATATTAHLLLDGVWTGHPTGWRYSIQRRSAPPVHHIPYSAVWLGLLWRTRCHLAAASDEEYQQARDALDASRSGIWERIVTSFLAPTETAWVDADCAAAAGRQGIPEEIELLVYAISSERQLALIIDRIDRVHHDVAVGVLVTSLGPAAGPLLGRLYDGNPSGCEDFPDLMATMPGDAAFQALLDRLDARSLPMGAAPAATLARAVRAAAARFPVRGVRLLAAAAGRPGLRGDLTRQILRERVRAYADDVDAVLPGLPVEARRRIEAVRAADRLPHAQPDGLPEVLLAEATPAPTLPDWADPALLPAVLVRDRHRILPALAVRRLCAMLAGPAAVADMEAAVAACDVESLSELLWDLLLRWRSEQYSAKYEWTLDALGYARDARYAPLLAEFVDRWDHDWRIDRAERGLRALAAMGTEVALGKVYRFAARLPTGRMTGPARELIERAAAARGLTVDALVDRLVPDVEPTADTGRASDDQVFRLERAMLDARRWTGAEFWTLLVAARLLRPIVCRLVWAAFDADGRLAVAFRVAEDGTFAGLTDQPVSLPAGALVGVPHPVHLGSAVPAWADLFDRLAIEQPFPQLAREKPRLTEAERGAAVLHRTTGVTVDTDTVDVLWTRGWTQTDEPDTDRWTIVRPVAGGEVRIDVDPGFRYGGAFRSEQQTLGPVVLSGLASFADIDPVELAEVMRDIDTLVR